jgi:polar amino acid transport system substrate-binding protein
MVRASSAVSKLTLLILLCCLLSPSSGSSQQSTAPLKKPAVPARSNVDLLAEIVKRGTLRVGIYETVPWTMHNRDGEWVGFEVDIARQMAKDMGVKVEFFPDQFRYLVPDLLAGRFDIIMAGFSIDAERALQMNFSNPYNVTDVVLAVNPKMAGDAAAIQDLNKPGVTVGVTQGSTAEDLATAALPEAKIRPYTEDQMLFNDLVQGKLTAAVGDGPRLDILTKLYPAYVTLGSFVPLGTFPASFAVQRGNVDFVNYLNSWIAARNADLWLAKRRAYWFGSTEWAKSL